MVQAQKLLRVAWVLCALLPLWTTDTHAQIIRGGGGNDSLNTWLSDPHAADTEDDAQASTSFQLDPGYPNPFNPSTQVRYVLQTPAQVQLAVYTLLGQRVQTLASGWHEAGTYTVQWDARNAHGAELASGTYLIRLVVHNKVLTQTVAFHK